MMVEPAQPGKGWGLHALSFHSIYHRERSFGVYAPAERTDTISLFLLYLYMYSIHRIHQLNMENFHLWIAIAQCSTSKRGLGCEQCEHLHSSHPWCQRTCKKYDKEIFPDPPFNNKRRKLSGYMIKWWKRSSSPPGPLSSLHTLHTLPIPAHYLRCLTHTGKESLFLS